MKRYIGPLESYHNPNNYTCKYQTDISGKKSYFFNDFGYRKTNKEFNSGYKIYVSGCSLTFGVGLDIDETWVYKISEKIEVYRNEPVQLWNFAHGGASNDYIVKSMLRQINCDEPNLAILMMTHKNRKEYNNSLIDSELIGPWNKTKYANNYYNFYSEENGFINFLKNLLLFQSYCKSKNIPYLISCVDYKDFKDERLLRNTTSRDLMELIDFTKILEFGIWDKNIALDLAADMSHPGEKANSFFSSLVFKEIKERIKNI